MNRRCSFDNCYRYASRIFDCKGISIISCREHVEQHIDECSNPYHDINSTISLKF